MTDNGDGTLTILVLTTGPAAVYGPDGKAIARNPGQVRFESWSTTAARRPTRRRRVPRGPRRREGMNRQDRPLLRGGVPVLVG